MKIICLVKFVPNVDNFIYDYEKNVLVRENVKLILNPDDACALAFALKIKKKNPDTFIEIISMAPKSIQSHIEDLLRRGVDKASLLSDKLFSGSDTYATSMIIGSYLQDKEFDCILCGTHSLDGDTAHVPAQLAELLKLNHMSNVIKIDEKSFEEKRAVIEVDSEKNVARYELKFPVVLGVLKESKYKLPFVKYKDLNLDVSDRVQIITNSELKFNENEIGIEGSLTKVNRTYTKKVDSKDKIVVQNNDEGIDTVYQFLKAKGFV